MQSLTIKRNDNGVAILTIDVPASRVNILSSSLFDEMEAILSAIESDPSVVAVVIRSGKPGQFVAGADLRELKQLESVHAATLLATRAQRLFDRIASSRRPFVAAIDGAALGGGLELALACHARIASESASTVFALPEILLGLIPAAGGTQRLPRLIGVPRAAAMMLTGERVRVRRALHDRLIDALVPAEQFEAAAIALALTVARKPFRRRTRIDFGLLYIPPLRRMFFGKTRREARRRTRGFLQAPDAILDAMKEGLAHGIRSGLKREAERFGDVATSTETRNLIWLFEATSELKKLPRGVQAKTVESVAVVGAGLMGEGIASVSLPHAAVVLKDVSAEALERAHKHITNSLEQRVKSGSMTSTDSDLQSSRLATTMSGAEIARSDLVIEAVFEDLELKQRVLSEIEAVVGPETVIASNTSALPISAITGNAQARERILGMHYFSPVPKMPLLEIVRTEETADWAEATARAFGIAQGKSVIVVRDSPGFYTTRILAPFINEAVTLLDEGSAVEDVDRAISAFGFPVGPLTLLDEVGIDVASHVCRDLSRAFSARGINVSESLLRMEAEGMLGRKSGRGFYTYEREKRSRGMNPDVKRIFPRLGSVSHSDAYIVDRVVSLLVNEAAAALAEGVISSPPDGDVGAILGLGFPAFLGGPFHWLDAVGVASIVARMRELEQECGPRYSPSQRLVAMSENGAMFYA